MTLRKPLKICRQKKTLASTSFAVTILVPLVAECMLSEFSIMPSTVLVGDGPLAESVGKPFTKPEAIGTDLAFSLLYKNQQTNLKI